ncbi:NPHP4 [Bugula neritina]|uniref:NPHP4 n=1 Tax=Bugula neritina TaxID=10212 RepID=A0A7J7JLK4_BUGNE|nr:NPHP4 [Bugula neritina]
MQHQHPLAQPYQGHVMSLPPPPTGYPTGPVGYPIEIRHLTDSATQGNVTVSGGDGDLEELPFTPVHATIMAAPPGSNTGSRLSRAAYARLYAANFPPILDRHKQDAEVVNPSDYLNFVMAREESDQLQCNEIVLQFLAFSR